MQSVFVDAFCWPNPGGVASVAAVFDDGEIISKVVRPAARNTNNFAELGAIIVALKARPDHALAVKTDSRYCADGFASWVRGERRDRKHAALFVEIERLAAGRCSIEWLRGGSHPLNAAADRAAREAALEHLPAKVAAAIRAYDVALAAGRAVPPLYQWLCHAR